MSWWGLSPRVTSCFLQGLIPAPGWWPRGCFHQAPVLLCPQAHPCSSQLTSASLGTGPPRFPKHLHPLGGNEKGSRKIEGEKQNSFPALALLLSLPVAQGWVLSVTRVAMRSPHPLGAAWCIGPGSGLWTPLPALSLHPWGWRWLLGWLVSGCLTVHLWLLSFCISASWSLCGPTLVWE